MSPSILEDSYISLYPNNSKQKIPNNPAPDGPFKTLESNPTSAIDLERAKTAPSSIKSLYHQVMIFLVRYFFSTCFIDPVCMLWFIFFSINLIFIGGKKVSDQCQLPIILELWFNMTIDENIGNYGYISISILWIYRRYIDGYFGKKKIQYTKKLIKTHKNIIKTSQQYNQKYNRYFKVVLLKILIYVIYV